MCPPTATRRRPPWRRLGRYLPPITNVGAEQPIGADTQQLLDLCTQLGNIDQSLFGIADLTGIEQLVKLQALDLSGNTSISNFSGLSSLRDLTSLNLSNAGVNDLSELSLLKNLADLKLDTNAFTSLEDMYGYNNISGLTNLTSVSLMSNHISTGLLGLATLYKAQSIDLTCSQAALENDIIALYQALDSGDGAGSGVVRWTICP